MNPHRAFIVAKLIKRQPNKDCGGLNSARIPITCSCRGVRIGVRLRGLRLPPKPRAKAFSLEAPPHPASPRQYRSSCGKQPAGLCRDTGGIGRPLPGGERSFEAPAPISSPQRGEGGAKRRMRGRFSDEKGTVLELRPDRARVAGGAFVIVQIGAEANGETLDKRTYFANRAADPAKVSAAPAPRRTSTCIERRKASGGQRGRTDLAMPQRSRARRRARFRAACRGGSI